MRKIDARETLSQPPQPMPIDLAARETEPSNARARRNGVSTASATRPGGNRLKTERLLMIGPSGTGKTTEIGGLTRQFIADEIAGLNGPRTVCRMPADGHRRLEAAAAALQTLAQTR